VTSVSRKVVRCQLRIDRGSANCLEAWAEIAHDPKHPD
jgi:hypothetical protein